MTVLLLLVLVVAIPAALGIWLANSQLNASRRWNIGARIVYSEEQASTHPVPHARNVRPAERGEFYYYSLVNYLRIIKVLADGRVVAVGSDQREFCFAPNDDNLRKARLFERVMHRAHFAH